MTVESYPAQPPVSLRILLENLVDYAGLFPPAKLTMRTAVENFKTYSESEHAWILGRFIVPASRLQEFAATFQPLLTAGTGPTWRLSALIGADIAADLAAVESFNRGGSGGDGVVVDAIELKAQTLGDIRNAAQLVPPSLQTFFEIPISQSLRETTAAISQVEMCAKVRTGGETAAFFPSAESLVEFLAACITRNLRFKATAGLHHPVRSSHRFTYEPDSLSGAMHGFLNVFLAASFMLYGMDASAATECINEQSADSFHFTEESASWRNHTLSNAQLRHARQSFCLSFGSCSFTEPVDDLHTIQLL
ncbi:MAG TPA: hypothetical protein VFF42_04100 [Candidatus Eremiobacteraceae bacterium]|nr:hypothetical protein [Candidatus Eremiobacteraceae bacterium]